MKKEPKKKRINGWAAACFLGFWACMFAGILFSNTYDMQREEVKFLQERLRESDDTNDVLMRKLWQAHGIDECSQQQGE